jgi:hypothetical protein
MEFYTERRRIKYSWVVPYNNHLLKDQKGLYGSIRVL